MDQSSLSYHNLKQDKELSIQDLLTKETKKKKKTTLQFTPLKFGVILIFPPRVSKFGLVPLLLCSILIGALPSIPGTNVSVKCRLSLSCMLVGPIKSCHLN